MASSPAGSRLSGQSCVSQIRQRHSIPSQCVYVLYSTHRAVLCPCGVHHSSAISLQNQNHQRKSTQAPPPPLKQHVMSFIVSAWLPEQCPLWYRCTLDPTPSVRSVLFRWSAAPDRSSPSSQPPPSSHEPERHSHDTSHLDSPLSPLRQPTKSAAAPRGGRWAVARGRGVIFSTSCILYIHYSGTVALSIQHFFASYSAVCMYSRIPRYINEPIVIP